ncbi:MAG: hypothetical protein ACK5D5_11745 [Bacteroidota bacterium]
MLHFSQNNNIIQKDTTLKSNKKDSVRTVKVIRDTLPETGVAISPSTLRFNVKPGTLQTKTIKVTNDTKKKFTFQLAFQDFGPSSDEHSDMAVSKYSMYALSKYTVISPTVLEIGPRQTKTITVTVDIPSGDSMNVSMWTILDIDQVIDREKLELPNSSDNTLGMGIKNSFGFGVNIYQNPPGVQPNNIEIVRMSYNRDNSRNKNYIFMQAKNTGNGIGYCLYYLELTNLITGKQTKLKVKQFSIFPGYVKDFVFDIPAELEKGPYSALAVLDFGNKEELQTAELEFTNE